MDNQQKLCAAGFSPTGTRQLAVYDPRNFSGPVATQDVDQGSGAMMLFYDADTSMLWLSGKGDGNIKYFEVTAEEPYIHFLSEFRANTSHKGIAFLPKLACDSAICEIALCLRLQQDVVWPISFQVPRKSDIFQADIFPDTYAGIPALTEADWISGKNADPIRMPFREAQSKSGSSGAAPAFQAAKSVAELTKELSEAQERIRQLEAKLASLGVKM